MVAAARTSKKEVDASRMVLVGCFSCGPTPTPNSRAFPSWPLVAVIEFGS
jgi:hypothetical protein